MNRRSMIHSAGILGASLSSIPLIAEKPGTYNDRKLKLLVAGAHPDDPETGCGGIMALYAKAGHEVVAMYLTKGEAGIPGTSHDTSASIRTNEAKEACAILNAKPVFAGQVDGSTEITQQRYEDVNTIIEKERPDIVLTHWPIDTHPDHRICSNLVYNSWNWQNRSFALYYFEVMSGSQTQNFRPTDFVDISSVVDVKHKACFAHVSQHIEEAYPDDHGQMELFRGMEGGYTYAEAFVRQDQSASWQM